MYRLAVLSLITCSIALTAMGQSKATLSGYIRDAQSGEGLIGATIYASEIRGGTTTNAYGFYSLSLPPGEYSITFNYLGFKALQQEVPLAGDRTLDVALEPDLQLLEAVEISGEQENANITNLETGVERMDLKSIKAIPQVLGEVDIIRSIQLLPGVSTVGEGATGFNVRGGNIDQNLILLDEATVYNSSHLFGFFSIFNADAVKDLTLYKGGIPARYGGRLSSVLDVRQKEGNNRHFGGVAGLGLVSSRLLLEGPILKDKASFMIAGRRSYGDLLLAAFSEDFRNDQLFFYDLNAKVNLIVNTNNRIFASGYFGADKFRFDDDFASSWGNATGTLRWNHLFGPRMFSNFTAVYSDYKYSLGVPSGAQAFEWKAGIKSFDLKADFTFTSSPASTFDYGLSGIYSIFSPGEARGVGGESFLNEIEVQQEYASEVAAYVSHTYKWSDAFSINYGLRYSYFANLGRRKVFLYPGNNPSDRESIIDTASYSSGEVIADYGGLEPRLAVNYTFSERSSIKLSYNRMRQYLHLVSNTTAATPIDIWMPAGKYIKPAIADQVSVGYFRNFSENSYRLSLETYFKDYQNLLDYKNGAELLLNTTLETELLQGEGRAYGLEVQLEKVAGAFTGWISYTLSRAEVKVAGINKGAYYPSNFDKTHVISVVGQYSLGPNWTFGGTFAFMTGRPVTYPDSRFVYEGITAPVYTNRNGARIPNYHRLDLSATWIPQKKREKVLFFFDRGPQVESSWTFSLYNVYGRRNPYSIYFRQNESNPQETQAFKLSIFGFVVPGITYNLQF